MISSRFLNEVLLYDILYIFSSSLSTHPIFDVYYFKTIITARNSEFAQNTEWIRATFPSPIRTSFAIVTADNVLVPEVMRVVSCAHLTHILITTFLTH